MNTHLLIARETRTSLNDDQAFAEILGEAKAKVKERRKMPRDAKTMTLVKDAEWPAGKAAVDYYFIQDDGQMFKCTYQAAWRDSIEEWLNKKYEGLVCRIVHGRKEDLELPKHLMGHRRFHLQLCFRNVSDLLDVRWELLPLALANGANGDAVDANKDGTTLALPEMQHWTLEMALLTFENTTSPTIFEWLSKTAFESISGSRSALLRGQPAFRHIGERVKRADPVVMAYGSDTTDGSPTEVPRSRERSGYDMVDGQGYLITNREIVSENIEDFVYTPMKDYEGLFMIFDEPNEAETIKWFFSHIQDVKPTVMAAFNGDLIDFSPSTRAQRSTELTYAVATYYLYMKYVHLFIFSLCNIIPLNPDEVLRKGSGTLCETLLMVAAYRGHIIMPNRHEEEHGNFYDGHLLASETYVGGHAIEALEAGIFLRNISTDFKITPSAVHELIDDLDAALTFCIVEGSKYSLDRVTNYDEVCARGGAG
ncbi:hypothetical protein F5878DRAFT_659893 [Lentinula raphanica]|uniref:DNA polymerase epsilon catalytic subunit n=1 Tax=Lentinula raphanica TaxID=153919 RepID=A0AA38PBU8_9AGAR|nr:hypothetical protein F5878DRAFT_659893 [Lentinula raphanica]